jgi:hypothetical protein
MNSQVGSSLSSVRPATLTPTLAPAQTNSTTFDVTVYPPIARPRVRLRDARGGARMMQVDSITFGSQELVGRDRAPSAHMRETKW